MPSWFFWGGLTRVTVISRKHVVFIYSIIQQNKLLLTRGVPDREVIAFGALIHTQYRVWSPSHYKPSLDARVSLICSKQQRKLLKDGSRSFH
jgi:hypothetical protein